jgi:type II secretory pathway pseudopilin PulG
MNRKGYSIVELLGVLLVLGLLIGLVLPAVRLVQRTSEKRRARAEATALVQAVMHYRQEYGHWPLAETLFPTAETNGVSTIVAGVDKSDMPRWLSDLEKAALPPATIDQWQLIDALTNAASNPRAIPFIEIPADCLDTHGRFVDPWRQPYVVIMEPDLTVAGWAVGDVPAIAFSFGPPATGSKGLSNLVFCAEVAP